MIDVGIHFLLFTVIGSLLILAPLVLGWLLRPRLPTEQKDAIYECGEPTIGSSYIQFDLRFYVVALLFIIFDVEVAFFYPWGQVYGGAMQLADSRLTEGARANLTDRLMSLPPGTTAASGGAISTADAMRLGWTGLFDILVFFAVLLVGFAYVWRRGDLDWVKAMVQQARESAAGPKQPPAVEAPVGAGS